MSETLLRALVQGTLVILAVACLAALPQLSTTARAWLWRLVPVKFAVALLFTGVLTLPLLAPEPLPTPLSEPLPTLAPLPEPMGALPSPVFTPAPNPFPWERVVLAVYALGVLVALARLAAALWRTRSWQAPATPLTTPELLAETQRLIRPLGLRTAPEFLVSSSLTSPGVVGVLRPRVILPETLLSNPLACRAALAHELAHVQRRDLLWCVLARFIGAFVWFHPLYWLSVRELCVAQELACDTLALRLTEATPALYGKTLLAFATGEPLPPLVAGSASQLKRRLRALQRTVAPSRTATLLAVLLLAPAVIPWQLTHAQAPAPQATRPGTITGRVVSPEGTPVAGARVRLVIPIDFGAKALAETRSDASGSFTFNQAMPTVTAPNGTEMPVGWLFADAAGHGPAVLIPTLGSATTLTLSRAETQAVVYQDTTGKPLSGLAVSAVGLSCSSGDFPINWLPGTSGTTDSQGRFQVSGFPADGRVSFRLTDRSWAEVRSQPGNPTITILRRGLTISGTVRFVDGRPAKGLRVWGNPLMSAQLGPDATSDSQGRYTLLGVSPGAYRVCVETWGKDYTTVYKPRVAVGEKSLTGIDFTLSPGAVVTGTIRDTAGKPLYGVWVGGGPASGGTRDYTSYAVTDKAGRYRVRVPAGKALVQLRGGSHLGTQITPPKPATLAVRDGHDYTQNFTINGQVPQELSGTLLTDNGQPLANALVSYVSSTQSITETVTTSAQGTFRFRTVWGAPQQTLYIEKDGQLAELTVPVQANQKLTVRWDTRNVATLTGRLIDPDGKPLPQASVRLVTYPKDSRVGDGRMVFTTDAQGRFERRVRASWRYRIEPEARGYGLLHFPPYVNEQRQFREPLALAPGQTHNFGDIVLPRANHSVSGTLVDLEGKPLAGVKVSVGSGHNQQKLATTDANGRFHFTELVRESLAFWLINSPYELAPRSVPFPTAPLTLQARHKQKQVGATPYFATTLDDAKALAAFGDRKILVEFTSHTNTQARDVEARVYSQPSVIAQLKRVVPLRLYTDPGRFATKDEALQNALYQRVLLRESLVIAPRYALVTTNGKLIAKTDYNTARDPRAFAAWLAR